MLKGLGTGTGIWMWPLLLSSYMVVSGAIREFCHQTQVCFEWGERGGRPWEWSISAYSYLLSTKTAERPLRAKKAQHRGACVSVDMPWAVSSWAQAVSPPQSVWHAPIWPSKPSLHNPLLITIPTPIVSFVILVLFLFSSWPWSRCIWAHLYSCLARASVEQGLCFLIFAQTHVE